MISGLTTVEIEKALELNDVQKVLAKLSAEISLPEIPELESVFTEKPEVLEERVRQLEDEAVADSTKKHEKIYVQMFHQLLQKFPQVALEEESCDKQALNTSLRYFYASLQRWIHSGRTRGYAPGRSLNTIVNQPFLAVSGSWKKLE